MTPLTTAWLKEMIKVLAMVKCKNLSYGRNREVLFKASFSERFCDSLSRGFQELFHRIFAYSTIALTMHDINCQFIYWWARSNLLCRQVWFLYNFRPRNCTRIIGYFRIRASIHMQAFLFTFELNDPTGMKWLPRNLAIYKRPIQSMGNFWRPNCH